MVRDGDAGRRQEGDQQQPSQDQKKPNTWLHQPEQTKTSDQGQLVPGTDTSRAIAALRDLFNKSRLTTPEVTEKLNELERNEGAGDKRNETAPQNALSPDAQRRQDRKYDDKSKLFEAHPHGPNQIHLIRFF